MEKNKGQVNLPFVLLVGGIIVEVALAGIFTAYFLSTSTLGERLASEAESAARSGIEDAMEKIIVNKEFVSTPIEGGIRTSAYSLSVNGNNDVTVEVTNENVAEATAYTYTIESEAQSGNREKKFRAVLIVDKITGKSTLQSREEISVQ